MSRSFRRVALLALFASTVLVLSTAWEARAGGCKANGTRCTTNISCCSRKCVPPTPSPGKARPLFGLCCGPRQVVFNGQCCTPRTACAPDSICGTDNDFCGGTINCGSCDTNQCLTCMALNCVSTCQNEQVCDGQGHCVTTTTTSTTSTTTTTLSACDPGDCLSSPHTVCQGTSCVAVTCACAGNGAFCQQVGECFATGCGSDMQCSVANGQRCSLGSGCLVCPASNCQDD